MYVKKHPNTILQIRLHTLETLDRERIETVTSPAHTCLLNSHAASSDYVGSKAEYHAFYKALNPPYKTTRRDGGHQ